MQLCRSAVQSACEHGVRRTEISSVCFVLPKEIQQRPPFSDTKWMKFKRSDLHGSKVDCSCYSKTCFKGYFLSVNAVELLE